MINKTYNQILAQAWSITIKNPILWILGFLSAFSLNTGIFEGSIQNISSLINSRSMVANSTFGLDIYNLSLNRIFNAVLPNNSNFFTFILIIALIFIFIYITTVAQIALIKKADSITLNRKKLTNEKLLHDSNQLFGTVLVLNILSRATYSIIFLISTIPLLIAVVNGNNNAVALSTLIFFIIFIPLSIILSLVTIFSIIYSILKNNDVITSIKNAWNMVRNNFLLSVEVLLSLFIIKLIAILVSILFASIIFIPVAIFITTLLAINKIIIFAVFLVIASIVAVTIFGFINALFATYYISTLTILFKDITSYKLTSKAIRIYNAIISKINLTKEQKTMVAEIGKNNNISKKEIFNIINKTLDKFKPKITKIIKDTSKNINLEATITKAKINLKELLEAESKNIIPTLKSVEKNVKSDAKKLYKINKPKVIDATKQAITKIEKGYPHLVKIKNVLEDKYRNELEKELAKVFIKNTSKKIVKKHKRIVKKVIKKKKV